jgi:hypothetical protein
MKLELKIVKEPEDTSDAKDGSRLLATVEILGASHHLEFLRVVENEETWQQVENDEYIDTYDNLQELYEAIKYETVEIPGFTGRYIAYMVPYEE